jgi:hypothetical protein
MNGDLEQLGEQIAELAAHLDAATYRLLTNLREFDMRGGWHVQGAMSCAHWLAWRVGWDLVTARERVRVANKLADFPTIGDALRRGELSYSKVRALLRIATPANEAMVLEHARLMTASQLEKLSRKYARVQRHGQGQRPEDDEQRRYVRRRDTDEGMVKIEAVLHPEEAELIWAMLDHAATHLTRDPHRAPPAGHDSAESSEATGVHAAIAVTGGVAWSNSDSAESHDKSTTEATMATTAGGPSDAVPTGVTPSRIADCWSNDSAESRTSLDAGWPADSVHPGVPAWSINGVVGSHPINAYATMDAPLTDVTGDAVPAADGTNADPCTPLLDRLLDELEAGRDLAIATIDEPAGAMGTKPRSVREPSVLHQQVDAGLRRDGMALQGGDDLHFGRRGRRPVIVHFHLAEERRQRWKIGRRRRACRDGHVRFSRRRPL